MTSVINNQAANIQKLSVPVCINAHNNTSPSLPAGNGTITQDPTTPGTLYVGDGTNWNAITSGTSSVTPSSVTTFTNKSIDSGTNTITLTNGSLTANNINTLINQDLRTSAGPSFATLTVNGQADFGTGSRVIGTGGQILFFDTSIATISTSTDLRTSQTQNRVITLPDATTTLTGTIDTATISNKTFNAPQVSQIFGIHLQAAPTGVLGPGAGTGSPSITITGTELCGVVSVTTGTSPTSNSIIATLTLANASAIRLLPVISIASIVPATTTVPIVGAGFASSTTWIISNFGNSGLTANTTYQWNYFLGSYNT